MKVYSILVWSEQPEICGVYDSLPKAERELEALVVDEAHGDDWSVVIVESVVQ